jgi:type 1 fimbriae regulatory protein FimB
MRKKMPKRPPVAPPRTVPQKPLRKVQVEPDYLSHEEVDRFFRAVSSVRDRAIFRLAYHAGLRASEVGKIELRDYSPRSDRIYIHRLKGSASGEHGMVREEARALRAWLKVRGCGPGSIFLSRLRRPISRFDLHYLMQKYGLAADIPERLRHFHIWKHTCCTHLFERGFGAEQVQDWVGHRNIQNTMKYGRITNPRRDQMVALLRETWK